MSNERLWAPWRMSYVAGAKPPDAGGCFLCRYRDSDADDENLVVARTDQSLVVLNRYPYNNGHLLIAPCAHKQSLEELDDGELLGGVRQIRRITKILARVMNAAGFNVGLNLGSAAGAGLPGHLHWHVVPRWEGDTNFMPVVGAVKVIPQSLDELYGLLKKEISEPEFPS